MKKIFISQPMKGKSDEEILSERERIISTLKNEIGDIDVLDTYFTDHGQHTPLQCLAKSLYVLSDADIAVFAPGWECARGCEIEHKCCVEYGINIMYMG